MNQLIASELGFIPMEHGVYPFDYFIEVNTGQSVRDVIPTNQHLRELSKFHQRFMGNDDIYDLAAFTMPKGVLYIGVGKYVNMVALKTHLPSPKVREYVSSPNGGDVLVGASYEKISNVKYWMFDAKNNAANDYLLTEYFNRPDIMDIPSLGWLRFCVRTQPFFKLPFNYNGITNMKMLSSAQHMGAVYEKGKNSTVIHLFEKNQYYFNDIGHLVLPVKSEILNDYGWDLNEWAFKTIFG